MLYEVPGKLSTACYHSTVLHILTETLHEELGLTYTPGVRYCYNSYLAMEYMFVHCYSDVLFSGNLHTVSFMTIIFLVSLKVLTLFSLKDDTLVWVAEYRVASSLSRG